ncbi:hypothetical protein [Bacillus coahuilensis]|uniref:hypothetical protein n=1 Tax=Bacillus coahuilensis TaxID=408580 RepID=UPI000751A59E|nr:hypothetical protein [Bacillus coahuilensis]
MKEKKKKAIIECCKIYEHQLKDYHQAKTVLDTLLSSTIFTTLTEKQKAAILKRHERLVWKLQ